jgi:hypothetical protein
MGGGRATRSLHFGSSHIRAYSSNGVRQFGSGAAANRKNNKYLAGVRRACDARRASEKYIQARRGEIDSSRGARLKQRCAISQS